MLSDNLILVLGHKGHSSLSDDLFEMGFTPFVRDNIESAIYNLRHEKFILVIYERNNLEVDPLEFIFNVRDVNENIPVLILGESPDSKEDDLIVQQNNVHVIRDYYKEFRNSLHDILPTS